MLLVDIILIWKKEIHIVTELCHHVNFHIYDLQTDIMKLLEAAQSRHLREVLKYKADGEEKFHNLLKEYNHFLQRQTFLPDTHRHVKHPNSVYLVNRNY